MSPRIICIHDVLPKYKEAEIDQLLQRGAAWWVFGLLFPAGTKVLHILPSFQTSPDVHPPLSQKVKRPGSETDYLSLPSSEVKNGDALPPLPHASSRHDA
jgi:hypothetical protein